MNEHISVSTTAANGLAPMSINMDVFRDSSNRSKTDHLQIWMYCHKFVTLNGGLLVRQQSLITLLVKKVMDFQNLKNKIMNKIFVKLLGFFGMNRSI